MVLFTRLFSLILMKIIEELFMKVVIWGFPLHTHTHSYIHYRWYKGFNHLGHETYWFDTNYPKDFDSVQL